jgi:hypothetical protein
MSLYTPLVLAVVRTIPIPHDHINGDDDDYSYEDIIRDIEKSGEILPMDAQEIAGVQEAAIRDQIAEDVIEEECRNRYPAETGEKIDENIRSSGEPCQEYGRPGISL